MFARLEGLLAPFDCNFYYQQNGMQSFTAEPQRRRLGKRLKRENKQPNVHCENCFRMECFYLFYFSLILQMFFVGFFFFPAGAGLNAAAVPKSHLQLSLCRAACAGALSASETTQQLSMTWIFVFFHLIPEIEVSSSDSK